MNESRRRRRVHAHKKYREMDEIMNNKELVSWSCKLFGLRGHDEHRCLTYDQFTVGSDFHGKYVEFRPNHCGRHLGKINGHKSTYVKVWRCTFWWIIVFNGKTMGKIVWMSSWGIWLAYPGIKVLATANSIMLQATLLVIGRCFKLTNTPCIFERRAVRHRLR